MKNINFVWLKEEKEGSAGGLKTVLRRNVAEAANPRSEVDRSSTRVEHQTPRVVRKMEQQV